MERSLRPAFVQTPEVPPITFRCFFLSLHVVVPHPIDTQCVDGLFLLDNLKIQKDK